MPDLILSAVLELRQTYTSTPKEPGIYGGFPVVFQGKAACTQPTALVARRVRLILPHIIIDL
jgi:hypothetical protein